MGGKARTIFQLGLSAAAIWASGGAAAGTVAPWIAAALSGATVAYGAWAARDAQRKAQKGFAATLEDRKVMIRSAAATMNYVYGRAPINGVIAHYREPVSEADPYIWIVLALPVCHQIQSIDEIYWGADKIGTIDAATKDVVDGAFAPLKTGSSSQTGVVPASGRLVIAGVQGVLDEELTLTQIHGCVTVPPPSGNPEDGLSETPVETFAGVASRNEVIIAAPAGHRYTVTFAYQSVRRSLRIWKFLGTPDQTACAELIAADPTHWTSDHRLRGIPYVVMRVRPDYEVFPEGLENIWFRISGKNDILDTRSGQSGYTENSALCARDHAIAQCNVLAGEIPIAVFNSHVNISDEGIPIGNAGTESRYTCNTVLSTEVEPINNLGVILSSCDGTAVASGPTFDIRVGAYEPWSIDLDDGDFLSQPEIVKGASRGSGLFNSVRGRAIDPGASWALNAVPSYESAFYRAKDKGIDLPREIDLPATIGLYRAQRLMKQMLHRARNGLTMRATFNMTAVQIAPEQTVRITHRALGNVAKIYRVKEYEPLSVSTIRLTLQEDAPALYEWDYDEAKDPDPTPNTNLPSIRDVPLLPGMSADTSSAVAAFGPNGELTAQCRVTWNPVTNMLVLNGGSIEVRYKRAQDVEFTYLALLPPSAKEARFPCKRGDILIIEGRCKNRLVGGKWSTIKKVADDAPTEYLTGNLISNSRLESTDPAIGAIQIPGWSTPAGDVPVDTGYRRLLIGISTDTGASWRQNGSQVGQRTYAIISGYIATVPLQRMLAFGWVCGKLFATDPRVADVWMGVNFYTTAGTFISQHFSPRFRASEAAASGLTAFGLVKLFITVPSQGVLARPFFMMEGIGNGDNDDPISAAFLRPWFGLASNGQVDVPPWSA